ncbi:MAG: TRL-like family protein [Bacteroidota bacterium]
MRKIKFLTFAVVITFMLSSCATVKSPLIGMIYTDVKSPVTATSNANSSKVGTSSATAILGLFASGDASIDAAMKNSGITKIHHVDEHATSFLGIFSTYQVFVYGE